MIRNDSIEQIIKRTGATYDEAKQALEKNGNDIVSAIIYLEKKKKTKSKDGEFKIDVKFILDVLKELLSEGTARKIVIKKQDKVVLSVPIIVGAIGLIWAPIVGVLGAGAVFVYEYDIIILKRNNEEIDVIQYAIEKAKNIKEKINTK